MITLQHLPSTESTNDDLRRWLHAKQPEEGAVVWTDFQHTGRGQVGNQWEAEADANLLFSLLLRPTHLLPEEHFLISKAVSLGIIDILRTFSPEFVIKWPNDIYHRDDKIAGILIENEWMGQTIYSSIVGVGLNVNQTRFLSNAPNPIGLCQITGTIHDRIDLLKQIIHQILTRHGQPSDQIKEDYLNALYRRNTPTRYTDGINEFEATIDGVDPDGCLKLRDCATSEIRRYYFKEVQLLR